MSPIVQRRLSLLINTAYFVLLFAVFYLVFKTFFGVLLPFIFALLVAAVLQRPVGFLTRKTPLKKKGASTLCVLLALVCIGVLIFLLVRGVFGKAADFFDYVYARLNNITDLAEDVKQRVLSAISFLPESLRTKWSDDITVFFDDFIENGFSKFSFKSIGINWTSLLSKGGGVLKDTVVQIPSVVISCVIALVACVFMTADYSTIKEFVKRQISPKNAEKFSNAITVTGATMKKMLKAYSIIVCITWAELTVGLSILKLIGALDSGFIFIIAFIIALIDIVPVLGTGTVLVPWAVYSFIVSNFKLGIGLIALYGVILVIRQVIEPKLVAGQAGLPPIVTIIAMYIGTKTFGVLGFFILPFMVILIKELNDKKIIHLFKTAETDPDENAAAEQTIQEVN